MVEPYKGAVISTAIPEACIGLNVSRCKHDNSHTAVEVLPYIACTQQDYFKFSGAPSAQGDSGMTRTLDRMIPAYLMASVIFSVPPMSRTSVKILELIESTKRAREGGMKSSDCKIKQF
ncbi:hypothetical protein PoB_006659800 [Plakobranchus ocellatus]|uniref:Uncharacterized protein n=1 Tax=Plakobranchus ocellatus TaxID=259542 RepID=A0AAV4D792_9GAST|nr:hypothetical protein PoB_006659800 [Plakobranchus ocellatus]